MPKNEARINIPPNDIGIATATHNAKLGFRKRDNIISTSINPITPFLVSNAILCSIMIESSLITSAWISLFIALKLSK